MASDGKWWRRSKKVRPGDGHPLKRFRWWQPLSRVLFHLRQRTDDGEAVTWSVDVRLWGDSDDGEVRTRLYRDGIHHATSKPPTDFPIPGGVIEVRTSPYGLKRCHFVADDGSVRKLTPDPASAEGRRAWLQRRHPGWSFAIDVVSVMILLAALLLGVPQIVEQITHIPWIAENIGEFTSPIRLPAWFNIGLFVATLVASTERALRLRYNWLLDGGLFDADD